jgi:eukaryotic-like serine/threonine-protein kinase
MVTSAAVITGAFGEHHVVSPLAAGTTGDVFIGQHATGRKVAIKVLAPEVAADAQGLDRYFAAVRAAGQIKHSSTLRVFDTGIRADGIAYVVSELLGGETLAKVLKAGRMSATQIAEIARQAALVLAAAHEDGIVHRALDPGRVFLVRDTGLAQGQRVKVLGFGAAMLGDPGRAHGYRAPEQWRDPQIADPRVDIYALGCIAFEMACGRPPFRGASKDEYATKHLEHPAPAARSLMPDVPPELETLLARTLAKAPDKRPRSMRELSRGFDAIGGGAAPLAPTQQGNPVVAVGSIDAPGTVTPPTAADLPAKPRPPRRWIPIAVVAAILVIGGGIALVAALRSSGNVADVRNVGTP